MTPAFKVLLCLCMLGLSFAAPKSRNIHWCVTTETEDKKCNDLVNSCSINEISMICVKKSSAEDCVKAISDGEADATSLDSEDVYKASLNPYNLKPIMTESYHPQRDNTPCLKHRQRAHGGNKPRLGAFVPKCNDKGDYVPRQCHGSTGHCWCVNKDGEEIKGTRTGPGKAHVACEEPASDPPVTCHYAVAVVKKSSGLQFDQLKGKRSCHSAVGEIAGWIAPMHSLLKMKFLLLDGSGEKSLEKAVSEFFSASCAPGATEENLCKQCAGQGGDKCKRSPGEPYHGDEGALRCLREGKGDVAFVENSALSEEYSEEYELLCPDTTRKPLSQYKACNFGKVPTQAVVTRSSGDKTKDIIDYLLQAQDKGCKLKLDNKNTRLITLPSAMDTPLFLGSELFNALKTMHGAPLPSSNEVRWCTQSKEEKVKCDEWSAVSGGSMKCTEPSPAQECIQKILKGDADAVSLQMEHSYTALKCGLTVTLEEYPNEKDLKPCHVSGEYIEDFGWLYVLAVVKKSDQDITWNNLKGKKSCHTGVGHRPGWMFPVSLINKKTCDIGSYFSESCAPGSAIDSNLCKLCVGDPQNPEAGTKCSPNDKEAYYGNAGAIRCLVEKGDVAFVPHNAVFENTDGRNPELWAKDLKSTDFELLCLDGSRAPVSDYKKCKIAVDYPPPVVTRTESVSDIVRILRNQEALYGRRGSEKDIFQMFSSNGQNLLFMDNTQCFYEFDRQLHKDILWDYFGPFNYTDVFEDNHCLPTSELYFACTFHHG